MLSAIPVSSSDRITLLDSLRGIAVLGILLMNIPYFALPDPAQVTDLDVLNERNTVNELVWWVINWGLEGTQRALFAIMFGAGIILFTQRQEAKTNTVLSADYFMRRQLWLMFFGFINFYVFLWIGDYLFPYACCALLLYTFRRMSPRHLVIAGLVCVAITVGRHNVNLYRAKSLIGQGAVAAAADTSIYKLTVLQKEQLGASESFGKRSVIESRKKEVETSIRRMNSGYSELYKYQTERGFSFFLSIVFYIVSSHLCFMFLGMAWYKNGVLTGQASTTWYAIICIAGLVLGMALSWPKLDTMYQHQFNRFNYSNAMVIDYSEIGRVLRSLGFFGLVMLLNKSGLFKWFFKLMQPVGQMAFTNYLSQALLMGIFFYGIGFAMFGKLQRYEIYYVVLATWILQIAWSHAWLRYFEYGPFEWIWRQLTYWKKLPLRKK